MKHGNLKDIIWQTKHAQDQEYEKLVRQLANGMKKGMPETLIDTHCAATYAFAVTLERKLYTLE